MQLHKILFVLVLIYSPLIYANPYNVGDKLPALSLSDQHDKARDISEQTQVILFSRDKAGGSLLTSALSNIPDNFLSEHNIILISDISRMPGFISKYIAIPSMRKNNYSMLLDHDGSSTKKYPDHSDTATLIVIESLQIKKIVYLASTDDIKQALKLK